MKIDMEIVVLNASPRRGSNTAALCDGFVEGVRSADPSIVCRRTDLADLRFTGCRSCFACKEEGGASYGRCAVRDDLAPLLERIGRADGLAIGSPIYLGAPAGVLKCLLERLLFAATTYERGYRTLARHIPVQTLWTMNATAAEAAAAGTIAAIGQIEGFLGHVLMPPQRLVAFDTCQFDGAPRGRYEVFAAARKERSRQRFVQEVAAACEAGRRMAAAAAAAAAAAGGR